MDAGFWNLHDADGTRGLQGLPAFGARLIVSTERRGYVGRRAGQDHGNLVLEIDAGEIVVAPLRDVEAIADEYQRCIDLGARARNAC